VTQPNREHEQNRGETIVESWPRRVAGLAFRADVVAGRRLRNSNLLMMVNHNLCGSKARPVKPFV